MTQTIHELIKKGVQLPVMENFYTIQGEGMHSGRAAYFVRLAGCDVGCVWCDVKESWEAEGYPVLKIEEIVERANKAGAKYIVITGGEPAMYNLVPLTLLFQGNGMKTAIETSGAHPLTGTWDWVCLSPKKFKLPKQEVYQKADELKVIVFNKHDLEWAEEQASKVKNKCKLYLQPEWDKSEAMLPQIIDYVKKNQKWNISLQTHKYMNIP